MTQRKVLVRPSNRFDRETKTNTKFVVHYL